MTFTSMKRMKHFSEKRYRVGTHPPKSIHSGSVTVRVWWSHGNVQAGLVLECCGCALQPSSCILAMLYTESTLWGTGWVYTCVGCS